jgi:uncharacterized protein YehS (DUF1456 family)
MIERNDALNELAHQLNENIVAVRGTLELMNISVTEDDLHELLRKAAERMDTIQRLSNDMLAALGNCLKRMDELKK